METKGITFVIKSGGCVVVVISSEKQVEIRSNGNRFCSLRNGEFFGVNQEMNSLNIPQIKITI